MDAQNPNSTSFDFDEQPRAMRSEQQRSETLFPMLPAWGVGIGLFLLTVIIYINVFGADFQRTWEDNVFITDNETIQSLSPSNLADIFTSVHNNGYIPVTLLTHTTQYLVFGENAAPYHVMNLLIHAVNVVLVFILLARLSDNQMIGILGGALFAVHPIQVESVAWISQLQNLLALFFLLASFLAYINAEDDENRWLLPLAWGLFALSVLSKSVAIFAPLLFLTYDLLWRRYALQRQAIRVTPLFIIGFIGAILAYTSYDIPNAPADGPLENAQLMGWVFWDYFISFFAPFSLNNLYFYDLNDLETGNIRIWLGFGVVILTIIFAALRPLRRNFSLFAMVWVWVLMLPIINIVPLLFLRADRFLYFPSVLIAGVLAALAVKIAEIIPDARLRWAPIGVFGLIILIFAGLTFSHSRNWKDGETLWTHHLDTYPDSQLGTQNLINHYLLEGDIETAFELLNNLGQEFVQEGDFNNAIEIYLAMLERDPNNVQILGILGNLAFQQGNYEGAEGIYLQAQTNANDPTLFASELGFTYFQMGLRAYNQQNYEGALENYAQALNYIPEFPQLHNNIGYTIFTIGEYDRAVPAFQTAIRLDPSYLRAWLNLAEVGLTLEDYALAVNAYNQAEQLAGQLAPDAAAQFCLALAELRQEPERALLLCQSAIEREPENGLYYGQTAYILMLFGLPNEALIAAQRAVEIDPTLSLNQRILGDALAATGQPEAAAQAYQRALEINPQNLDAQLGLQAVTGQ